MYFSGTHRPTFFSPEKGKRRDTEPWPTNCRANNTAELGQPVPFSVASTLRPWAAGHSLLGPVGCWWVRVPSLHCGKTIGPSGNPFCRVLVHGWGRGWAGHPESEPGVCVMSLGRALTLDEAQVRCASRWSPGQWPESTFWPCPSPEHTLWAFLCLSIHTCRTGLRRCRQGQWLQRWLVATLVGARCKASRAGEEEERGTLGEVTAGWDRRGGQTPGGLEVFLGRGHSCPVVSTAQEKTLGLWILVHTLSFIFGWEFMDVSFSHFLSSCDK